MKTAQSFVMNLEKKSVILKRNLMHGLTTDSVISYMFKLSNAIQLSIKLFAYVQHQTYFDKVITFQCNVVYTLYSQYNHTDLLGVSA